MRRFLLSALAALGVALLAAAPATARTPARAVDFDMRVADARASAATADRPWLSRTLHAPRRFSMLGLRWRHAPEHLDIEVRVRRTGGRWTRWVHTSRAHSTRGSDPVWAGAADDLQIRLSQRVRGLRVHFVRVRPARPARRPAARAAQGQPGIVPRSAWAGDACPPRDTPTIGRVQMAFVHHTVGTNDYTAEQSASIVLAICRFHRNGNGWDDIGYNFLVDKYGQVFEGRAGGIDQAIVGAQAQGYNSESTGIANLGTHDDAPQSEAALQSIGRLIAWKLPLHGAPVEGTVTVPSAGGSSNRYSSGTPVTFERISGHRDGNATECPGRALYAQLPRLREIAARSAPDVVTPGAAPPTLSIAPVARSFVHPEPVRVAGRLVDPTGAGIGGERVRVQIATATAWRTTATTTTASDGSWAADVAAARSWSMRALAAGIASPRVRGVVAPAVTAAASTRRVTAGRSVAVTGTVAPRRPTVLVDVARKVGGRYVRSFVLRRRARRGAFRTTVPLRRPGLYRVRVRTRADRRYGRGRSAGLFVRATSTPTGGTAARAGR